jgi:ribosomal protein S18 acetylase RimI-like enzyme
MEVTIERAKPGDEAVYAYVQTESWKAAFRDILSPDVLERCTQINRATEMYRQLLEQGIGNGYLLTVQGEPHCIAWWDASRDADMPDYAELICIHSLSNRWGMGYGSRMMEKVLLDMATAGYRKVMLWVFAENARARCFYETHGFLPDGKTKPFYGATEICYEKHL